MTNPKLKELASLLDGACKDAAVEKAAMVIVGEVDERLAILHRALKTIRNRLLPVRTATAITVNDARRLQLIAIDVDDEAADALAADTEQSNAR